MFGSARPFYFLLSCAAAAACHARPDDAPPAAASAPPEIPVVGGTPRLHRPGELARARDYSLSVDSVKECPMDAPFAARRGFTKVGIELSIEGATAVEVPANPFYATVVDASGAARGPTLAGCEPGLPSVRVTAGKNARGFVTFELPKSLTTFELRYAPVVVGGPPEELRFSIQR